MSATDVTRETGPKMDGVVEDFKRKLGNVRTGRATVGLLDSVHVDYYGRGTCHR
jgi:ribosome recycling factor